MKFYLALILSAVIHITAGFFIGENLSQPKVAHRAKPALLVSIQHTLAQTNPSKKSTMAHNKLATETSPFDNYLPEQEVEIKALPVSNIDETAVHQVFISGLPIKMRLYINDVGQVVKIDKLDVLAQDRPAQDALEKILLEMSFLPAKKSGASVNSYQEIAFSFN